MSSISQSSIDTGIDKEHNITEHLNYSFRWKIFVDIYSRLKTCWYWKVTPYEGVWKVLAETYQDRKTTQQCRTLHRV